MRQVTESLDRRHDRWSHIIDAARFTWSHIKTGSLATIAKSLDVSCSPLDYCRQNAACRLRQDDCNEWVNGTASGNKPVPLRASRLDLLANRTRWKHFLMVVVLDSIIASIIDGYEMGLTWAPYGPHRGIWVMYMCFVAMGLLL